MYRTRDGVTALALCFLMAVADARFDMKIRDATSATVPQQIVGLKGDGWLEVAPAHWLVKALPECCTSNALNHDVTLRVVQAVFGPAIIVAPLLAG